MGRGGEERKERKGRTDTEMEGRREKVECWGEKSEKQPKAQQKRRRVEKGGRNRCSKSSEEEEGEEYR